MNSDPHTPTTTILNGKRNRRKVLTFAFVSFLLTILMSIFIHSTFFSLLLRDALEEQIQYYTGESVWIGNVDLHILRKEMKLDGVVLYHPNILGTPTSKPAISIPQTHIEFQITPPFIKYIHVQEPQIDIEFFDHQFPLFQNLPTSQTSNSNPRIDFDIIIDNASIEISHPKGDLSWKDINLSLRKETSIFQSSPIFVEFQDTDVSISLTEPNIEWNGQNIHIEKLIATHKNASVEIKGDASLVGAAHAQITTKLPAEIFDGKNRQLQGLIENHAIFQYSKQEKINELSGTFKWNHPKISFVNRKGFQKNIETETISIDWHYAEPFFSIQSFQLPVDNGIVQILAKYNINDKYSLIQGSFEQVPILEVLADFDVQPIRVDGIANGNFEVSGNSIDNLTGNIQGNIDSFDFSPTSLLESSPILELQQIQISGDISIQNQIFFAELHKVNTAKSTGNIDFSLDFSDGLFLDLAYDYSHLELSEMRPLGGSRLKGSMKSKGTILGPIDQLNIEGILSLEDFSILDLPLADHAQSHFYGYLLKEYEFTDLRVQRGTTILNGPMSMNFGKRIAIDTKLSGSGNIEDLSSIFFKLSDVHVPAPSIMLDVQGYADHLRIKGNAEIQDVSIYGEYFDEGSIKLGFDKDFFTLSELTAERYFGGNLLARGSYPTNKEKAIFEIMLSDLPIGTLNRIRDPKNNPDKNIHLSSQASGNIILEGSDLRARGRIILSDNAYNGVLIPDTIISFQQGDKDIFEIQGNAVSPNAEFSFFGESGNWFVAPYSFQLQSKDFPIHAFFPMTPSGENTFSSLTGQFRVSYIDESTTLRGNVERASFGWKDTNFETILPWAISLQNNELRIDGFQLKDKKGTTILLKGHRMPDKSLSFRANGLLSLESLRGFMPTVEECFGFATVDASLTGSIADPDLRLDVNIEDASMRVDFFPHPLEQISSKIKIVPSRYTIESFAGNLGGGSYMMRGIVSSSMLYPQNIDLQIETQNNYTRLIEDLPPIKGDSLLRVTGSMENMLISGDYKINELNYTYRFDWEDMLLEFSSDLLDEAIVDYEESPYHFLVNIKADKTIRIRNNLADMRASASLQLIGDANRPGMKGWIRSEENGRLMLKERNFDIERGEVRYIDPYTFHPQVQARLNTQIRSANEDYDITYLVEGLLYDPTTKAFSSPSLPVADINALLLFGMTREEMSRIGGLSSALVMEGSDLLASKFGMVEKINEVGEGILQLEMMQLDRIDLTSGSSIRESGSFATALRLIVEKDFSEDTTLSYEQNLTNFGDVYVGIEQRLTQKFYLQTFWASKQQGRYLDIGGAYGSEFQVRWEID